MESSRAKIAGPVIAAGAVSLGLVLIGACGLGKHDTYVAPPPIKSVGDAAPVVRDGTTATAPRVVIPPSPSWQVAPAGPPRKPVGFTDPSTSPESESESTTRVPRTMTMPATTAPPPIVTAPEFDLPTTRPRPTTDEPTTTRRQATTSEGPYGDDG
ncbi:hypothetical protein OG874_27770 [Nocardia sp. NBC_00565]|uniref:hypothetical protein n=1 Tax=Nocardia sp. NBC_00565 TaxID=2975993 RepID=UPI002E8132FD|nr:hypothetical protein [Nocardia sp. NBC_00565]WUC00644.1 hypothetical protein OG874_27770 [Nocardia sp. NBC_00565]